LVFLIVAYAEGMKVEIPVAFEKVRGLVPKLPLKFFYVSNIPVIFASALIMSIQLFSTGLGSIDNNFVHMIGYTDSSGRLVDGFLYLLTPIYVTGGTEGHFNYIMNAETPIYHIPEWVHAIVYILALSCIAVMFGLFWVETSGMDPKSMAEQLTGSGMQIPGFRRDPRMLELILSKHIIPLTIVGSFCVGMLTGLADLTGALGTGTGILLTVGILYKMYEQMEQMNILEAYPGINSMLGGGK
ncbi:MAG: preprotein translocase subunit SecY, partial [Candidatus Bilamarchaeaceae archaeon]